MSEISTQTETGMSTQTEEEIPEVKVEKIQSSDESDKEPDFLWTNLEEAHKKVWKNFEEARSANRAAPHDFCGDDADRRMITEQRSFVFNLDLSYQQLKRIPKEIGCLNKVVSCNLSGNDLADGCFPEEFFEMSFLEELDLSYNHLEHLPPCLCMFIDLKKLNITGNKFEVASLT
eukprot:591675-Rhodomonas_salina.5